jgi:hypothetical protein
MSEQKCTRCGNRAQTIDNITETSFWGLIQTNTKAETSRSVRVAGTYIRGHGHDSRVIRSDEEKPLCDPCWSLLVGQFMQGRAVAAVEHEHQWRRAGNIGPYPRELCDLCQNDRIAHHDGEEQP